MVIMAMKKPLAGLVYFAGVFLALGVLAPAGFGAGAFLAGAGLAFATGADGLDSTAVVSTLYGASALTSTSSWLGLPNKNSLIFVNIMFSYAFIY
jgi:hypothetical protein